VQVGGRRAQGKSATQCEECSSKSSTLSSARQGQSQWSPNIKRRRRRRRRRGRRGGGRRRRNWAGWVAGD